MYAVGLGLAKTRTQRIDADLKCRGLAYVILMSGVYYIFITFSYYLLCVK